MNSSPGLSSSEINKEMNEVIRACQQGNDQTFLQWLSQQTHPQQSLNHTDGQGWSLLHHAVLGGNTKIVSAIVQKGGDVLAEIAHERNTPLNVALMMTNKQSAKEIASILVEKMRELEASPRKNRDGNYPLHLACAAGYLELVEPLRAMYPDTAYVANSRGSSPLGLAIAEHQMEVVDKLFSDTLQNPLQFSDFKTLFPTYKGKRSLAPPVEVYVVGDNTAGKSTLIRSIQSESLYQRFWGVGYNTPNVPTNKAGLIPNDFTSRKYGRVVFYDLASGPHCVHRNLVESPEDLARSLFLVVVDGRPERREMERRLEFWLSFISMQCKHLISATSPPTRPNVIIVASHGDYIRPFRNDNSLRLRLVYRAVVGSNRQLATTLNLIDYYSLDCRRAQSPKIDAIRSDLHKYCKRLRPDETKLEPLYSQCYILSEVLRELEADEEVTVPALTLEDLTAKIQQQASQQDISLYHLLPRDTTRLLKLCEDLEDRKQVLLEKSNTADATTWIIYGKQKLAALIDKLLTQFSTEGDVMPGSLALMTRDSVKECLAPLISLGMDVIDKLLEHFKFHDGSFRDTLVNTEMYAEFEESSLYFFPTNLPSTGINEPWDMDAARGFAWRILPDSNQECRCFQPRFLLSLLLLLFDKCYRFDQMLSFNNRYLWSYGVLFVADELEVCVMIDSKAITVNMRYSPGSEKEILPLRLRNMILNQIEEHQRSLQPQTTTGESIVPKEGAKLPLRSPSTPKKQFRLQDMKESLLSVSSLSLASTGTFATNSSNAGELSEPLPFFEPCLSLCGMDSFQRQFLFEQQYSGDKMTPHFLIELHRCLSPRYYNCFVEHFDLPLLPQLHTRTPSVMSGSTVSIVRDELTGLELRVPETIPETECTTYNQLVACIDSISIFRGTTANFLEKLEARTISPPKSNTATPVSSVGNVSHHSRSTQRPTPESKRLIPFTTRLASESCSQANLSDVHFVNTLQVFSCPSSGGKFHSKENGITMTIPEGAVPDGLTPINIEFGVALLGQFELPNGVVPVSPFMWFCSDTKDFTFERPIEISLPHFMNCASEIDCENLVFMKADHRNVSQSDDGKFVFKESKDKAVFKPRSNHGSLSTTHSCFICIGCKVPESVVTNANYCLIKVKPRELKDNTGELTFCTTYFLETCFESVHRQFREEDYTVEKKMISLAAAANPFSEPEIHIQFTFQNEKPGGWVAGNSGGNWTIAASDITFWNRDVDQMRILHKQGMYPPRFTIEVDGTAATSVTRIDIDFTGLKKKVQFQIPLAIRRRKPSGASISSNPSGIKSPSVYVLDRLIFELKDFLSIDHIRPYLRSQGTLSSEELDELLTLSTLPNVKKITVIETLVSMLRRKGDEGLVMFKRGLEATLDETGHATILQTLNEDEEYLEIEARYNAQ